MDLQPLLVCTRCGQAFKLNDQVLMVVPYRRRGEQVLMGEELLIHQGCVPLPTGTRAVGSGRYREVIEGIITRPWDRTTTDLDPVRGGLDSAP